MLAGIAASLLSGRGDGVLAALQDGTANAVGTVLKTSGAYLLWMGLLNVAEQAGLVRALSKLLSPVLRLLFPDAGRAKEAISLNLAANLLGMGNAATPYGLDAMRLLNEANPRPGVATNAMCVLLAVNASGSPRACFWARRKRSSIRSRCTSAASGSEGRASRCRSRCLPC